MKHWLLGFSLILFFFLLACTLSSCNAPKVVSINGPYNLLYVTDSIHNIECWYIRSDGGLWCRDKK